MLVCVAVLFLLVALFLPGNVFGKTKGKASRITCVNNLRQIALAFRMWSNEHGDKFPWDISSEGANGGTHEVALTSQVWRHFQAISNELTTPKVLVCGDDRERQRIANWDSFTNNSHLSYFIGLDANASKPQTILSGDRNLAISNRLLKGDISLTTSASLEWTTSIHNKNGNLTFADGSAAQTSTRMLNKEFQAAFLSATQTTLQFVFPQ